MAFKSRNCLLALFLIAINLDAYGANFDLVGVIIDRGSWPANKDQRIAVVRENPSGRTQVVKIGDTIGSGSKVISIDQSSVLVEDNSGARQTIVRDQFSGDANASRSNGRSLRDDTNAEFEMNDMVNFPNDENILRPDRQPPFDSSRPVDEGIRNGGGNQFNGAGGNIPPQDSNINNLNQPFPNDPIFDEWDAWEGEPFPGEGFDDGSFNGDRSSFDQPFDQRGSVNAPPPPPPYMPPE